MTDDQNKRIRIELDQEKKIIRLGCFYHELKGILICEATEEEKKKYYCGKFMTYPVVNEDWEVCEDDCITGGIGKLIIGRKGDTVPLIALKEAIDSNADIQFCHYSEVLVSLEREGITISSRKALDSEDEMSDTVVITVEKVWSDRQIYRIEAHEGNYYIPTRYCYVGEDDELYLLRCEVSGYVSTNQKIIDVIAEDVYGLIWFFHKPNLRMFAVAIRENHYGRSPNKLEDIPEDWYYTVQTLDTDINRRLDELCNQHQDDYYGDKLPDIPSMTKNDK